jgi:hypothetical protein
MRGTLYMQKSKSGGMTAIGSSPASNAFLVALELYKAPAGIVMHAVAYGCDNQREVGAPSLLELMPIAACMLEC